MMTTDVISNAAADTTAYRQVDAIHAAPRPHWVGDGFFVHSMFNHMVADKRTDPFLLLDYAAPQTFAANTAQPRGVGQHPHKGFETVTIAYRGEVAHRDSAGGGGVIKTGDVQWMTAGDGVIHEEFHSPAFSRQGGEFEMVQLWVNLPAKYKATPPRYQHLTNEAIPTIRLHDDSGLTAGSLRVIAGDFCHQPAASHLEAAANLTGIASTFTPMNLWDIRLDSHKSVELLIPQRHNLLLLSMAGETVINADSHQRVMAHQLVTFCPEAGEDGRDRLRLTAGNEGATLLLLSGEPIAEPIVGYGPFVMNNEQQIRQAMLDFRQGKFGQLAD